MSRAVGSAGVGSEARGQPPVPVACGFAGQHASRNRWRGAPR
eukprot:CAMPEP_0179874752 /NCGR_PEP_ID=MMETSP0982-20121206/23073_1 /TAXON_ID=483367 /ORGANISM="non described non described, Strain CCMP 2436" /LENGTH=41 /DNA_ID= /DNA_START= /DNA_END= /DNA_ORIENTATION=